MSPSARAAVCPPWEMPESVSSIGTRRLSGSSTGASVQSAAGQGQPQPLGPDTGANAAGSSEAYSLRAPWSKDGEDPEFAMENVLESRQARRERRCDNYAHDRAMSSSSQQQMEAAGQRFKNFRTESSAERVQSARRCGAERQRSHTEVRAQHRKLGAEKKRLAAVERAAAAAAGQTSLERKRRLNASERQSLRRDREESVQEGRTASEQTSGLRKARNQASVAHAAGLVRECRDRGKHTAETLRRERLQAQERAKAHVALHRKKAQVRGAWMVEEKEEQTMRMNDLILERAEAFQARAAARTVVGADATLELRTERQRRQAGTGSEVRARDKQAWEAQREAGRGVAVAQLQATHMKAMARKRAARQELQARTVEPLRRRSQFAKERNAGEKSEQRAHEARMHGEQQDRQDRRAATRKREATQKHQPFALG